MPTPTVPEAVVAAMRADRLAGLTLRAIAVRHGVSAGVVSKYTSDVAAPRKMKPARPVVLPRTQAPALPRTVLLPPPAPPRDPVQEAEERASRNRELSVERELLRDVAGERSFRAFLEKALDKYGWELPPPPKFKPARCQEGHTKESLLTVWSDWHYGHQVKAEEVLGLNDYNASIARRRVWRIVHTIASIKAQMERGGGWRFPELVIALNGDLCEGVIHEAEKTSDLDNVVKAVFVCGMLLAMAVRDVAAYFANVRVYCTSGNHGRLGDTRRVQTREPTRNWDTLVALFAKTALRACETVDVVIPNSYAVVYELEGHRFLQSHGHDIRSWQNIPFYGIGRMATNINALRSAAGTPIQYFLVSHFHNKGSIEAAGGEYFVNGSLIGGTAYSVNGLGRADKPCQWLLGVHKEHGVTHRWPIAAESAAGSQGTYDLPDW